MSEREVKTARYWGECKACYKRHISKGDRIIEYGSGWAELDCAVDRYKRCRICGTEPRMDGEQLRGEVSVDCPECEYHETWDHREES